MVIGGGVGTAIAVVNVNQTLQRTLIESTPQEMMLKNQSTLAALGAGSSEIDGFLENQTFSPWQQSIITSRLEEIGRNPTPFLQLASKVSTPQAALDLMQLVEIVKKHHQSSAAIVSLDNEGSFLVARDANGGMLFPIASDWLGWTPSLEAVTETFVAIAKADPKAKSLVLTTGGHISPEANLELAKRGIQPVAQAIDSLSVN
jgi:hypothetical protein